MTRVRTRLFEAAVKQFKFNDIHNHLQIIIVSGKLFLKPITYSLCEEKNKDGLANIEDSVDNLIRRFEDNIKKQRKIDYSDQKPHKQHEDQENNNN